MTDPKEHPAPTDDDHQPDTDRTQQTDNPVPGRQRYRSARPPGDYTSDFEGGGTIDHPVKSGSDGEESTDK